MPDTAFFRLELFDFLRQLKRHNNRDWFAKNKRRYEEAVQGPALLFIGSFGPHLQKLCPHFVADPRPTRGSLFRIYRDTRCSPRTSAPSRPMSAYISPMPAARTPMPPCSIFTWSRRTASRRQASGIPTTAP